MQQRQLGKNGPMVGAIGFGAMSFGGFFGATDKETSHKTLHKCLELGVNHIDTALIYGPYVSEEFIGEFLKENPSAKNQFSIATKGGIRTNPRGFDNSEAYLRECIESSLKRLNVDYVDLFYVHRRQQEIPIEQVTETLAKFIKEGKIGGFGYSEISPASLERASKIHPVMAVQSEYSLWTRLPELGLIQACKRLGTAFVAFSPLARGMFGKNRLDPSSFAEIDFRRQVPRFNPPHYERNVAQIDLFKQFAADHGWSPAALALAFVLAKADHIIPIPGTRTPQHLAENAQGASIRLTKADLLAIEEILPVGFAHGNRYSDAQQIGVELYC